MAFPCGQVQVPSAASLIRLRAAVVPCRPPFRSAAASSGENARTSEVLVPCVQLRGHLYLRPAAQLSDAGPQPSPCASGAAERAQPLIGETSLIPVRPLQIGCAAAAAPRERRSQPGRRKIRATQPSRTQTQANGLAVGSANGAATAGHTSRVVKHTSGPSEWHRPGNAVLRRAAPLSHPFSQRG